jgi:DNA processing protein
MKGTYLERDELAVAIVGSRRCTHYGRKQAARLASNLACRGYTIVSGLARGIDGEAHRAALRSGGRTLAVLGCGLSTIYPQDHVELAMKASSEGALLSELPMSTPVRAENFPPRNRIISGLSLGTVVVEAADRSGSLITARWAGEQGRAVMAVPGNVDRASSQGCHDLIRDGAVLVESADDVTEAVESLAERSERDAPQDEDDEQAESAGREKQRELREESLEDRERQLYEMLGDTPRHIDALVEQAELPAPVVSSTLVSLEIKGLAKQLDGSRYVAT